MTPTMNPATFRSPRALKIVAAPATGCCGGPGGCGDDCPCGPGCGCGD